MRSLARIFLVVALAPWGLLAAGLVVFGAVPDRADSGVPDAGRRCFSRCAEHEGAYTCYYWTVPTCRAYERECVDSARVTCVPVSVSLGPWEPRKDQSQWPTSSYYGSDPKEWGTYPLENSP